ncbi:PREDICTED: methylthioribose-1-phosphate isomerase-like [Amphimedon queenslandica]|uniref:Methylthioribose-1-phosphate isomerase n=1 Tax=Amphimedon queenslandica TaxID=400682 RepID=A0A1X7TXM5_AMPQE|nr:PREDICTED: methylthioribose-1-phosphate isomerase-like [Amphimedon queenslandica]|eukprot:XP_003389526.1 PREDICTED: methylthioribose-1-phosphate isomerase-like [Amphimedon queenslandica]
MSLQSIVFDKEEGKLSILNQLLLPDVSLYEEINTVQDAWDAIKNMKTRGAPAIAIVGALSIAVELKKRNFLSLSELSSFVNESFSYLQSARPTAVNITEAAKRFSEITQGLVERIKDPKKACDILYKNLYEMLQEDISTNTSIGRNGAEHILTQYSGGDVTILTHCNTGSLACAGYGTALGVIRSLQEKGRLKQVYCTETRPYNQGSRLTAYELVTEGIPGTLICDSMAACLMKERHVSAVVVGADRVVANGDTANKIGTYQLAVVARYHGIPFYIAAPFTTIDFSISSGSEIVIEERKKEEMICFAGKRIAPEGINCWNPAFDVTPGELITGGIITERGVFTPTELINQKK